MDAHTIFSHTSLEFYGATISIIELESTIARNWDHLQFNLEGTIRKALNQFSRSQQIQVITQWCMKKLQICLPSSISIEKLSFNDLELNIENTYNLVWKLNLELKLRTLDAIQLSSAVQLRIYDKIEIQYFLTNDKNILDHNAEIFQKSRILPISSTELLQLLPSPSSSEVSKKKKR